jgi:hypothetical protein
MGANMILSAVSISKKKKPDFEKGEELIAKLEMTPADKWPAEFTDRFNDDLKIGPMAAALRKSLEALVQAWAGHHREAAWMNVCGRKLIVTGGLSWGDPPTDLMSDIENLLSSGVAQACGFSG